MNATELFHQDGKSAAIFYCSKCRCVARTREDAERCCAPVLCADCGAEIGRHTCTQRCDSCFPAYHRKEDAERRAKHLAESETVDNYDGAVFWDGAPGEVTRASSYFTGDNDGFFIDMDDLLQAVEETEESVELPEFVFCCAERPFHLDLGSAIESVCDDMHEDAAEDLEGVEELQAAVDAFNERNKGVVCYHPDFRRKVRVARVGPAVTEES